MGINQEEMEEFNEIGIKDIYKDGKLCWTCLNRQFCLKHQKGEKKMEEHLNNLENPNINLFKGREDQWKKYGYREGELFSDKN